MNDRIDLPFNWITEKLGDVMDVQGGSQPPKSEFIYQFKDGYVQLLQIRDFGERSVPTYVPKNRVSKFCTKDDVLIARYGASLGRIVTGLEGAYNVALAKTIFDERIFYSRYIYYLLQTSVLQVPLKMISRSAQNGFAKHEISHIELPIPPTNEQHRIVAKIEALFSELDKGIESFKTARKQLTIYRQALLKHAFSGKLTEQWRAENQNKLESAETLLQRIQTERQQRYQQQLKDWETSGKQGSKPKALKALPPLTAEELAELPELPTDWVWARYGDLCTIVKNGIPEKPIGEDGTPIFRISAVRPMFFDMSDIRYIDNSTGRFDPYYLERGDLVFTRYNGSRHYVGVCAEYRSDQKCLFPDKLVQTRIFSKQSLSSSYLEKALNCGASRKHMESKIRTTAGQSGVSGDDIKSTPVPICSIDEQFQIVDLVELKLTVIDRLDQTITTALLQAESLRQSILKKAFAGQLVPQDPNDEPASVLLERINTERVQCDNKSRSNSAMRQKT